MSDEDNIITEDKTNLGRLEALLFAAPGPCTIEQLARVLRLEKSNVIHLTDLLEDHYRKEHGIRLQRLNNQFQLVTAPEYAELIEQSLGLEVSSRLTQPALEVLAIIAYKQTATRPEIENIRGVNSDGVVKSLLAKGLIEELGRSDAPGRPILYGVTSEFMEYFGLESLEQLPAVDWEERETDPQAGTEKDVKVLKN